MRPPLRISLPITAGAYAVVLGAALATQNKALIVLALLAGIAPLCSLASYYLAAQVSTHLVYQLHDPAGNVIYVGESEDGMRRMYEHTDGTEHEWYRDIAGFTIPRRCWNDRQAKRIERRRITVINLCSERKWCDPLRNEQHEDRHRELGPRIAAKLWKPGYLLASMLFDSCTFHTPAPFIQTIPPRPGDGGHRIDEEWDASQGADGTDSVEASYEPRSAPPWASVTPIALPPVSGHRTNVTPPSHSDPSLRSSEEHSARVTSRDRDHHQDQGDSRTDTPDLTQRGRQILNHPFPLDLAWHLLPDEQESVHLLSLDELDQLNARLRKRKSRYIKRHGVDPTADASAASAPAGSSPSWGGGLRGEGT